MPPIGKIFITFARKLFACFFIMSHTLQILISIISREISLVFCNHLCQTFAVAIAMDLRNILTIIILQTHPLNIENITHLKQYCSFYSGIDALPSHGKEEVTSG